MCAILIHVDEIQMNVRSEKYVSICSNSLAALIALQAARTMSPLVQQCQKMLNDISTWYSMGLFWVPKHAEVCGTEISNELAKERVVFASLLDLNCPWGSQDKI
jgi:hypothetical protein